MATLIIAALVGFAAAQPPAPRPASAPADHFAAARAMADVRVIARVPHVSGSSENTAVRSFLVARLKSLGFDVRLTPVALPAKARERLGEWGSADAATAQAINITALRPGRDPASPAIAVMAHYDSVWASPGAADDAAGVAAALEIARAISRGSQQRDFVLLFTDAEEIGLHGAKAFFAPPPAGDPLAGRIGAVINLESRGGGGRAIMFETGSRNGEMVRLFRQTVADPSANSLAVKIYELLPNSTDFTPAKALGIPGVNFAFMGDARLYHSPLATPDALDQRALQHIGAQGLDITRALLTAATLPKAAPDIVFSDVLGQFVIAYPEWVGWLVVAATAALIVAAARRHSGWRWRNLALGALDGLIFTIAAGLLLYFANLLSGADAPTNYYDRLAALPRLEVQALLLMGAALAITLGMAGPKRQEVPASSGFTSPGSAWLGLAVLNLAIVAAIQLMLPAAAPIIAWPLLLTVFAVAVTAPAKPPILPAIAAIFGLAFAGGFAHFTLLAIGSTTPGAIAAFAPLALLLITPLLPAMRRRTVLVAAFALILAAASLALWVRLDPIAASVPPYKERA